MRLNYVLLHFLWRASDKAPARRKRRAPGVIQQLPLFEIAWKEKAVGANETGLAISPRSHLHLVKGPFETEEP